MALTACSRAAEVRYRVSVEIEEDGQARTGSSIWVWQIRRPTIALGSPYDTHFSGEAVVVPLQDHPTVFALLVNANADQHYGPLLVERLFGRGSQESRKTGRPYDRVADVNDIANRVGERIDLDCRVPGTCPMLVWFGDPNDPTSIQSADSEQLPQVGSDKVFLRKISVEITSDDPKRSIFQAIPWLKSVAEKRATLIPRPRILPGQSIVKHDRIPVENVGTRSFSTDLFL